MSLHTESHKKILRASRKHPAPPDRVFQYGTAGFRMKAELLDSVVFRVGLFAALRSSKQEGQTVGVMITASHNPHLDNGVKVVDPMGEMLDSNWERYLEELVNAHDEQELIAIYARLSPDHKREQEAPARVVYARDTRASSPALAAALRDGLDAADCKSTDYGVLTTPQLHYMVRAINCRDTPHDYGEPSKEGYCVKLSDAYRTVTKHKQPTGTVFVDCANGVGGPKLEEFMKYMPTSSEKGFLNLKIVNADVSKPEILNHNCGADYVKTTQRPPHGYKPSPGDRFCSFDGDADRLMYYFSDDRGRFHLLDGDRIATLAAAFLSDLARQSGLGEQLRFGVVQTAYANGASTNYVENTLKLPIICTPTGVKHLHHAATRFDVGVYFEANGHGTVLFSTSALKALRVYEPKSPAQLEALQNLRALVEMINQTVGDAISDMLLVECVLAHKKWGPTEWFNTYTDLPNRLLRVEVADRSLFKTTDAERKLESPKGLQEKISATVAKFKNGRAFARASGTEDAVRVYAEANSRSEADDLAAKVAELVRRAGDEHRTQ